MKLYDLAHLRIKHHYYYNYYHYYYYYYYKRNSPKPEKKGRKGNLSQEDAILNK